MGNPPHKGEGAENGRRRRKSPKRIRGTTSAPNSVPAYPKHNISVSSPVSNYINSASRSPTRSSRMLIGARLHASQPRLVSPTSAQKPLKSLVPEYARVVKHPAPFRWRSFCCGWRSWPWRWRSCACWMSCDFFSLYFHSKIIEVYFKCLHHGFGMLIYSVLYTRQPTHHVTLCRELQYVFWFSLIYHKARLLLKFYTIYVYLKDVFFYIWRNCIFFFSNRSKPNNNVLCNICDNSTIFMKTKILIDSNMCSSWNRINDFSQSCLHAITTYDELCMKM